MLKLFLLTIATLFISFSAHASDKINIFACEPEWAALANEIGGDKVEAFSATTAMEDPHHIRARPSLIAAIRKADILICSGAGLESGWLPVLLQKAGNSQTQQGGSGYIMAADYINVLEKPSTIDRSLGDIHPEGNPHLQLNPHNILIIADILQQKLSAQDTANAAYYDERAKQFSAKWQAAIKNWEKDAANLRGMGVITHHKSFAYLIDWLGLKEIATLEAKPGIPPSKSHLEQLLQTVKSVDVKVIIRTPYEPDNASKWLAEKTSVPAIILPYTIGGNDNSTDLFSLFDQTIKLLKNADNK